MNRNAYEEEMEISIPYVSIAYKLKAEEEIQVALKKTMLFNLVLMP